MALGRPCCCISSRTGAIIIGVLEIIFGVIGIFNVISGFAAVKTVQSDPVLKEQLIELARNEYERHPGYGTFDEEGIFSKMYVNLTVMLVVYILNLFLASILIHGILKENTQLLKAHLVITGALLCLSLVGAIYMAIGMGNFVWILIIIAYVLSFYFFMVIYYAYLEVRNKVSQRQNPVVKYEVA